MNKLIVSFGEIVWDQFNNTEILGGAPLNVAYHLQASGQPVRIVSRIGRDALGQKTLEQVKELDLAVNGIQQDSNLPTGRVVVSLDRDNEPHFEIAAPAAWDNIELEATLQVLKDEPFHLVFGTLSQRNEVSRKSLHSLLQKADTKFYDVNLRPPYTPPDTVRSSLHSATIVKVNRDELKTLATWFLKNDDGRVEGISRELLTTFNLSLLAVTDGGNGAHLITMDEHVKHQGFPVQVADPVGSGDAFFAALINSYLSDLPIGESLLAANKNGAWVASQQGATPRYPLKHNS